MFCQAGGGTVCAEPVPEKESPEKAKPEKVATLE
jgi:hypothetical protein